MKNEMRSKYSYTLSPGGGLGVPTAFGKADTTRAEHCENLILRDGALRKRSGWRQVAALSGRINGIWAAPAEDGCFLVHAGQRFYRLNTATEPWSATDVTGSAPAAYRPGTLTDTRSEAFCTGGRLYIVGCGDYLVYGSWDGGTAYQLRRVYENEDTTVPLTSHRTLRNEQVSTDAAGKANLLTRWRRNTLGGIPATAENNNAYFRYLWAFDSPVATDAALTFRYWDGAGVWQTLTFAAGESVKAAQTLPTGALGECVAVTLDRTNGYLWFYRPVSSDTTAPLDNSFLICLPTDGTTASANIAACDLWGEVTFRVPDTGTEASPVCTCSFGILYGGDGAGDRLYLGGNSASPGTEYYSAGGGEDFTYFPASNQFAPGGAGSELSGFARLTDNTLAVFRNCRNPADTGVYYQTLKSGQGENNGGASLFTVQAGTLTEAPVSRYAVRDLGGEVLLLSKNGIFGLTLTDNVATAERKTRERGRSVATALAGENNPGDAVATVHEDRYYLSLNGHCYVADARYRFKPTGTLEGESEYEWWYWENVPARVFGSWQEKLLFGTDTGRICVFDGTFSDRTYTAFSAGEVTLSDTVGGLTLSAGLTLQAGDRLRLTNTNLYARLYANGATVTDGLLPLPDGCTNLPEGLTLAVTNLSVGGSIRAALSGVKVRDVDPGGGTMALAGTDGTALTPDAGTVYVYLPLAGRELYVRSVTEQTAFLSLESDGTALFLVTPETPPLAVTGQALFSAPVCAKWTTPLFFPEGVAVEKSLRSVSVTPYPGTAGSVTLLWQTREDGGEFSAAGGEGFSFAALTFSALTFAGEGATMTERLPGRRFRALRLIFENTEAADFALPLTVVTYVKRT